jgi:hypothetical protein
MRAHVAIVGAGSDALVSLDGVPVPAGVIAGLDLHATPNRAPRLELRFVLSRRTELELGAAEVVVDPGTAAVLQRLGWIAPAPPAAGEQPSAAAAEATSGGTSPVASAGTSAGSSAPRPGRSG